MVCGCSRQAAALGCPPSVPSDPILRFPPFEIDLAGERLMRGAEADRCLRDALRIARRLLERVATSPSDLDAARSLLGEEGA